MKGCAVTHDGPAAHARTGSPIAFGRMGILDGLRFLAAASVMLFHFAARKQPSWGSPVAEVFPDVQAVTQLGAFGVDLFFVISGFVIPLTAWGRSVGEYAASRISRLYPAYWACVLLTGFLLLVLWTDRKEMTPGWVAVNLTMLQEPLGVPHVDGVYWTLWAELRFYLLIGILVALRITASRLLLLAALWPPLAVLAERAGQELLAEILISGYAPLFAGGVAIYVLTRNHRSVMAWLVLAENLVLGAVWSGSKTQALIGRTTGGEIDSETAAAMVLLCFALVAAATLTRLRAVSAAWLTALGLLTYPLYLLHEYWGWWVIHLLHDRLSPAVTLLVAIAVVLAMAWLVQRFVERPVGRPMRRALERWFRAPSNRRARVPSRS